MDETVNKLVSVVSDTLCVPKETITLTTNIEDLGADSLDIVELALHIEEVFEIEVSREILSLHRVVKDIARYINNRILPIQSY